MEIRVQKIIADAGVCSRRKAEELIEQGAVKVNGHPAQIGMKADPYRDLITVNGERIPSPREQRSVYLMLYKPRDYLTAMSDDRGRKCVSELVADVPERVYPVGRLDYDSEGLLIMTNDGDLTLRLTHPSHEAGKTYRVSVRGDLARLPALSEPMVIDGYTIRPAEVHVLSRTEDGAAKLEITIHEGRNRQIRKMCAQCGLEVRRLKRVAVGKIGLDPALAPGKWRRLTPDEIAYLKEF